jgi:hypothetical protein
MGVREKPGPYPPGGTGWALAVLTVNAGFWVIPELADDIDFVFTLSEVMRVRSEGK